MASRAILWNLFEKQWTKNHPQYLSGLSRALFPTAFLETAVYDVTSIQLAALVMEWFNNCGELAHKLRFVGDTILLPFFTNALNNDAFIFA